MPDTYKILDLLLKILALTTGIAILSKIRKIWRIALLITILIMIARYGLPFLQERGWLL